MVCMESPAVDFKAGVFTGNEHEGYADHSAQHRIQELEKDHNIILEKYRSLKTKHRHLEEKFNRLYTWYFSLSNDLKTKTSENQALTQKNQALEQALKQATGSRK